MPGTLQPLDGKFAIVDANGNPTLYFTQWAQQRQIDITDGITAAQAQQAIDDWAAARQIIAGRALDGGGFLSGDVTIDHAESLVVPGTYGDATHVPKFTVDQEGHVQGVVLVPISGGGGGAGLFPINVPPAFATWVNQGTATVVTNSDGTITLIAAKDSAENIRGVFRALPATPWSFKIGFVPHLGGVSFQNCGIALRESSSGKMVVFCAYHDSAGPIWFIVNYNSPTSKNANVLVPVRVAGNGPKYLKIADDGTTRTAAFGDDPYAQLEAAYSVAHNSFIVPDQIGIITNNINTTVPLAITVFSHQ